MHIISFVAFLRWQSTTSVIGPVCHGFLKDAFNYPGLKVTFKSVRMIFQKFFEPVWDCSAFKRNYNFTHGKRKSRRQKLKSHFLLITVKVHWCLCKVLSNTFTKHITCIRLCEKDFWGPPRAMPNCPLASKRVPNLRHKMWLLKKVFLRKYFLNL